MSIAPDEVERSRAAVAVSCLRWLQYSGPATEPGHVSLRDLPPPMEIPPKPPARSSHPLWDRWLDV